MADTSKEVRRMLGLSLHGWEDAMVVALVIAGAFALVAGVATWAVVKLQRIEISQSAYELDRYKSDAKAALAIARADIAKASAQIAEANERAATAERKRAELEKQTAELREKVANRRITPEQNDTLVKILSRMPSVVDLASMGDSESGLYAADFLKTFENAGWTIGEKTFPLGEIWTGLLLFQSDDKAVLVIAAALTQAKIPFAWANAPKTARAKLLFGGRPPFF
jgi:hypothetical protein